MEEYILDDSGLEDIVKKILHCYIQDWNSCASHKNEKYNHVDITLSKQEGHYYLIRVTKYGSHLRDIRRFSHRIFTRKFISSGTPTRDMKLATIHAKSAIDNREMAFDLKLRNKRLSLTRVMTSENLNDFSHYKEYLSIKLKGQFRANELQSFNRLIQEELDRLQSNNVTTKFTYHCNQDLLYNSYIPLDDDIKSCEALSSAFVNVIQHSFNKDFTEQCFTTLNITNSYQAETVIMTKLLPLIHSNYTFSETPPTDNDSTKETMCSESSVGNRL